MDDIFSLNPERFRKITDCLKNNNLIYTCNVNIAGITEDLVKQLKNTGCQLAMTGIESGSDKILNFLNKNITVEQIIDKFEIINKYDLNAGGYFILRVPGETEEDINKTTDLIEKINLKNIDFSIYFPFIGSDLYNQYYSDKEIDWSKVSINLLSDDYQYYNLISKYIKSPNKLKKYFFLLRKIKYKMSTNKNYWQMFKYFIKNYNNYIT